MLIGALVGRKAVAKGVKEQVEWTRADVAKARKQPAIAAYHEYIAREIRRLRAAK